GPRAGAVSRAPRGGRAAARRCGDTRLYPGLAAVSSAAAVDPQPFPTGLRGPEAEVVPAASDLCRWTRVHDPDRQARVRWLALGQLLVSAGAGRVLQARRLPSGHEGTCPPAAPRRVQLMLNILSTLLRILQEVNSAMDLATALDIIVKRVREAMETHVCSVYLLNPDTDRYELMATEGLNKSAIGVVSLASNEGLVGYVGVREEPVNLEDAASHPRFRYFAE